jgi:hypothetical protein
MITEEEIDQQTHDERCAWLASLDADETLIVHTPCGHKSVLVFIAHMKRVLQSEIPTACRLKFLEGIASCRDHVLSEEAIAAIEPLSDEGQAIVDEAMKLGARQALDIFARWEVFAAFVALDPSLLEAIKICENRRSVN